MKKIIIGLFLSIFSFNVYADHADDYGDYYFQQIPALCSTSEKIENYLKHYNFKPVSISLGREGMVEGGQPVFMITYYITADGTQSAVTIDVPSGIERCIMYHTFDLTTPQ